MKNKMVILKTATVDKKTNKKTGEQEFFIVKEAETKDIAINRDKIVCIREVNKEGVFELSFDLGNSYRTILLEANDIKDIYNKIYETEEC